VFGSVRAALRPASGIDCCGTPEVRFEGFPGCKCLRSYGRAAGFEPGTSCTPNSLGKIARAERFQLLTLQWLACFRIEVYRCLWLFVALTDYVIIYSRTACFFLYNPQATRISSSDAGGFWE
jgi:hypothetical protein